MAVAEATVAASEAVEVSVPEQPVARDIERVGAWRPNWRWRWHLVVASGQERLRR
ncbi:hypothetical protein SALBM311S_12260 [Streptomyces alboniger]